MKTKNGYTLVEMLVAMTIFAVLMTVSYGAAISAARLYKKETALRELQNDARNIVDFMKVDVERPDVSSLAVSGGTVNVNFKDVNGSPQPQHTFSLVGNDFMYSDGSGASQALNSSTDNVTINTLTSTSAKSKSFKISMTLTRRNNDQNYSFSFETAIAREDMVTQQ